MKKFLICILSVIMVISFISCGGEPERPTYNLKSDDFEEGNPDNRSIKFKIVNITTIPEYGEGDDKVIPRIGNVFLKITLSVVNLKTENATVAQIKKATFKLNTSENGKKFSVISNAELKNRTELDYEVGIGESREIDLIFSVKEDTLINSACYLECDLTAMPGGNCYLAINEAVIGSKD